MAQLFLPTAHTPADRVLAAQVAASVESAALYVTWTPASGTTPAALAEPIRAPERAPALALLAGAVAELWGRLRRPQGTVAPDARRDQPQRRASPAA
jgi:hypothetical protein